MYIIDIKLMRFCGCSHDSVFILAKKPIDERLNGTDNLGMKDIINCKNNDIKNLGADGLKLVELCVDFLIFDKENVSFPKRAPNSFHSNKYITLWSFIYSYIGLQQNGGYDYWLMNFLEYNNICDHGSGIRCAWFNDNENNSYYGRILSDEVKQSIFNWATDADDGL